MIYLIWRYNLFSLKKLSFESSTSSVAWTRPKFLESNSGYTAVQCAEVKADFLENKSRLAQEFTEQGVYFSSGG